MQTGDQILRITNSDDGRWKERKIKIKKATRKKRERGSEQVIEIVLEYLYASYKMSYVIFI